MFKNLQAMWASLSSGKRAALITAILALLIVIAWVCYLVFRENLDVLFADLDARDQAAIVSQLDKLKIPYKISEDGRSILVERDTVHQTRLKVMADGVDIKGTVGFEVFNGADYGASEFAQKINFQRALQGELSRTILSIEGVKYARVLLAMPDGGYLRKRDAKPVKASVALTLKDGASLTPEQVLGIQRLVASSVQDLDAASVVVSDQKGVTLSRPQGQENGDAMAGTKLEMKKLADQYLTRKLADLLDKALGPGQAIVSVDVTLNHDQITSSREELLGRQGDQESGGMLLRKKSAVSKAASPSRATDASGHAESLGSSNETTDVEYAYGKRVENVVGSPGNIKRISVGVMILPQLDQERIEKLKDIVSMAMGFNGQRGDGLAIQSLAAHAVADNASAASAQDLKPLVALPADSAAAAQISRAAESPDVVVRNAFIAALLFVLVLVAVLYKFMSPRRLTAAEKSALLAELQTWLDSSEREAKGKV